MNGGIEDPTYEHAMTFLKVAKITLQDQREKYDELLQVLGQVFDDEWVNKELIMLRVKQLLRDHVGLLFGFNVFLPQRYQVRLPLEDDQQPPLNRRVQAEEALNFLGNIRMTDFEVYNSFLDLLRRYRRGSMPVAEVYWEAVILFEDHIGLIREFEKFVPTTDGRDPIMHLAELISRGQM